MSPSFKAGAREGFRVCLPVSVGLIPWALVTGLSMVSVGFTPLQAMGMSLIVFGATAGALMRPEVDAGHLAALAGYGRALGLAFQIVDDILDVTADSATLGKTAGKDAAANKPTYVALMGLEAAQRHADALAQQALQALVDTALDSAALQALEGLAGMVVRRQH